MFNEHGVIVQTLTESMYAVMVLVAGPCGLSSTLPPAMADTSWPLMVIVRSGAGSDPREMQLVTSGVPTVALRCWIPLDPPAAGLIAGPIMMTKLWFSTSATVTFCCT